MIIVDIGALKMYRSPANNSLFFIQPEPIQYMRMVMEKEKKQLDNITVLPFAMSNHTGTATLHIREFPEGHSLKERLLEPIIRSIKVPTLTWNDFVEAWKIFNVDLCIIDTEGSEEYILEEMTTVLPEKIIMAGYHSYKFKNVKTCKQLQEQLIEKGYLILDVKNESTCAEIHAIRNVDCIGC